MTKATGWIIAICVVSTCAPFANIIFPTPDCKKLTLCCEASGNVFYYIYNYNDPLGASCILRRSKTVEQHSTGG